ncbi:MAG: NAD-dependent epimerase/dehydratase family protein [Planctomycetota bacterium]
MDRRPSKPPVPEPWSRGSAGPAPGTDLPAIGLPAIGLPPGELLVTGGAGFVGSHLVEHLLARGRAVHVLDDLSSGSLDNLAHLHGHRSLRVTVGSAADAAIAAAACADAAAVFHLAGMVGVQRLCQEPVEVMRRNLQSTEVMLGAAARVGVPILITSSSEVYGQGPVPFREGDPVRPGAIDGVRGGYACAKAMGEWLALAHHQQEGLPVVVARLFNAVGPRQTGAYGMVLPRFVQQALAGQPITVFGDGSQTRCFGAVDEIARALAELLAQPRAFGACVNVGSDRETSVLALARLVRAAAGGGSDVEHVTHESVFPRGFVDPPRRVPCLARLRDLLGWVPSRPLEAIVEDLVAAERAVGAAG